MSKSITLGVLTVFAVAASGLAFFSSPAPEDIQADVEFCIDSETIKNASEAELTSADVSINDGKVMRLGDLDCESGSVQFVQYTSNDTTPTRIIKGVD